MRSRNCARWPVRAVLRDSNSFSSPATAIVADALLGRLVNWAGNATAGASSRSANRRASRAISSSNCDCTTPSRGFCDSVVETQHNLSLVNLATFFDENLAYHAAGRMLHLLYIRFDHDRAWRNHSAG